MSKALKALLKLLHSTQRDGISYEEEGELYKTIRTALTSQTWQGIDVKPDKAGYYLCSEGLKAIKIRWYSDIFNGFSTDDEVTHWMPLPNPPEQKEG